MGEKSTTKTQFSRQLLTFSALSASEVADGRLMYLCLGREEKRTHGDCNHHALYKFK